jgi:ribosome-associated toxin RatA of RatAB toxin-antitoxin module
MVIHFNDSATAKASAEELFDVITDYANYPSFNDSIVKVAVVKKDEGGAEFVADRTTRIGKQVRAYDRYERNGNYVVERKYAGNESAVSTWTIQPIDKDHCKLTIDAEQSMGPVRGVLMKPALKKIFYKLNFAPFIGEAERRARSRSVQTRD